MESSKETSSAIKLPYGLKTMNGLSSLVDISEIQESQRGEKCGCVCPKCGESLIARIREERRVKHFAHKSNDSCWYEGIAQMYCRKSMGYSAMACGTGSRG